jgi:hypothetical protein
MFKHVSLFLLASLVFHESWLRNNLPPAHPLFSSHLFVSGKISALRAHLATSETATLKPTGIPPHLSMAKEMAEVVAKVDLVRNEILSACRQMPQALTDTLLTKFNVAGAIPVTMDDMKRMMNDVLNEVRQMHHVDKAVSASTSPSSTSSAVSGYASFEWGERIHPVPNNFILPTINIKDIWNLYWNGNKDLNWQPYRFLRGFDVSPKQEGQLAKTKKLMGYIVEFARKNKLIEEGTKIDELTKENSSTLFDRSFGGLLDEVYGKDSIDAGRKGEASVATIYQRILDHKRKQEEEKEREENPTPKKKRKKRNATLTTMFAAAQEQQSAQQLSSVSASVSLPFSGLNHLVVVSGVE